MEKYSSFKAEMNGFPVNFPGTVILTSFLSVFFFSSSLNINFKAYKELLEVKVESENII